MEVLQLAIVLDNFVLELVVFVEVILYLCVDLLRLPLGLLTVEVDQQKDAENLRNH
jgi:hypothetical protein